MGKLQAALAEKGLSSKDVMLVHLYVNSMTHFAEINAVYIQMFGSEPPSRVSGWWVWVWVWLQTRC